VRGRGKGSVLLIEDDADIRDLVAGVLERAGFTVHRAADGAAGMRDFFAHRPDLVVLDVAVPELDGWEVLERIRELSETPVLMLTAHAQELDKVRGLRSGADDYVTKPFGNQELLARIEALLRRARPGEEGPPAVLYDELVEIDFAQRSVRVRGAAIELTPTEFRLLAAFARHPRQVLDSVQLLDLAWGDAEDRSPDQVKLYVSYLRRKLRAGAGVEPISTVRGFGYRYDPS
jgi:DNA-binding response OmpR family regulator